VWNVLQQVNTAPLEVRDLQVSYGPTRAVDGVSLEVRGGEIFGLLGPNGAGKPTRVIQTVPATTARK
jgi:ABC-type multidrug transport system ATPase subunit